MWAVAAYQEGEVGKPWCLGAADTSVDSFSWEFKGLLESTHGERLQWGCLACHTLGVFGVS